MQGHIKKVVVFCGSRPGEIPGYMEQASRLGRLLAENGYEVIYGSGEAGLMGAVANGASSAGGIVHGINVHMFNNVQGGAPKGVQEKSFATMLERKAEMLIEADASITLPGGIGSLDELGDATVQNDVMIHHKENGIVEPAIIVNMKDSKGMPFYKGQLEQYKTCLQQGFTNAHIGRYYQPVNDVDIAVELLNALNEQGPVPIAEMQGRLLKDDNEMKRILTGLTHEQLEKHDYILVA